MTTLLFQISSNERPIRSFRGNDRPAKHFEPGLAFPLQSIRQANEMYGLVRPDFSRLGSEPISGAVMGIDFGTSFSRFAVFIEGSSEFVSDEEGNWNVTGALHQGVAKR
jgi:hypothetical protein